MAPVFIDVPPKFGSSARTVHRERGVVGASYCLVGVDQDDTFCEPRDDLPDLLALDPLPGEFVGHGVHSTWADEVFWVGPIHLGHLVAG